MSLKKVNKPRIIMLQGNPMNATKPPPLIPFNANHGLREMMVGEPFIEGRMFPSPPPASACDDDDCIMIEPKEHPVSDMDQYPQNPSLEKDLEKFKSFYQEKENEDDNQVTKIDSDSELEEESGYIKMVNYEKQFINSIKNVYKSNKIKLSRSEKRCSAKKNQIEKLQAKLDKLKDEYNVECKKQTMLWCKMYKNKYGFSLV